MKRCWLAVAASLAEKRTKIEGCGLEPSGCGNSSADGIV